MPLDAERIVAGIEQKRTTVGTLGRELAAIRKAALGTGPVTPGTRSGPPQTDNEAGEKPQEPAAPDAEEDIGGAVAAPETIGAKQLTPAQKAARDLADALGLLPDQKALKMPKALAEAMIKGGQKIGKGGMKGDKVTARGKLGLSIENAGMRAKYNRGPQPPTWGKKSAEELAAEFYMERGEKGLKIPPGILAKFRGGLRKVPGMFKHELMNTPSSTIGGIAGVAGTGILLEQQRRERKRQGKLASLFGIKQAEVLAEEFYLERANKNNFMPRNEREQTQEMPNPLPPGSQGEPEEALDPSEMQSLRGELDLTPMEADLFDQLVADGGGIENVEAGQEPQEVMAPTEKPAPEPGTPKGDNMPDNGMGMFGQAPPKAAPAGGFGQDKPQEAVPGQLPTDTNPGSQLEAPGVERPEGASYQSEATGSETSEAAPEGMSTEMSQMIPGATRNTLGAPPMTREEASQEGQTEEEAFQSLVAKLERAQEMEHQGGQKSFEYDDKGIGSLLAKAGRFGAGLLRRGGRAATHGTQSLGARIAGKTAPHMATPGLRGTAARGAFRGGSFMASNPKASMAIGAGAAGTAQGMRQGAENNRLRRQMK